MGKSILLIGGGGHCHSVLDTLCSLDDYERIGIVAKDEENFKELKKDDLVCDYLVGIDADLPRFFSEGWNHAFVTLGSIGSPKARKDIYALVKEVGFTIPTIIDKSAIISKKADVGEGVFVGKNTVVNIGCSIGNGCIINTGSVVEHDCKLGDFVHISPGAVVCGQVTVGNDTHIGAATVVRQCIVIGENSLIGAGSVVVKDIPGNVKAFGNPCKVVV